MKQKPVPCRAVTSVPRQFASGRLQSRSGRTRRRKKSLSPLLQKGVCGALQHVLPRLPRKLNRKTCSSTAASILCLQSSEADPALSPAIGAALPPRQLVLDGSGAADVIRDARLPLRTLKQSKTNRSRDRTDFLHSTFTSYFVVSLL